MEVALLESRSLDADELAARIEAFDPQLVGVSAYVWSFPTLLEVCRRAKAARPDRTVIFGGPSARPEMFELPQHSDGAGVVDAIVVGDGEACIQEILLAPARDRATLLSIPGLAVHDGRDWLISPPRDYGPPDRFPSPYQLGLMPRSVTGQIESFRGCPLSCTYCEWGDTGATPRVFGYEHLVRELEALRELDAKGTWLVDPGLNLSSRAFSNLRRAEAEVGTLAALGSFPLRDLSVPPHRRAPRVPRGDAHRLLRHRPAVLRRRRAARGGAALQRGALRAGGARRRVHRPRHRGRGHPRPAGRRSRRVPAHHRARAPPAGRRARLPLPGPPERADEARAGELRARVRSLHPAGDLLPRLVARRFRAHLRVARRRGLERERGDPARRYVEVPAPGSTEPPTRSAWRSAPRARPSSLGPRSERSPRCRTSSARRSRTRVAAAAALELRQLALLGRDARAGLSLLLEGPSGPVRLRATRAEPEERAYRVVGPVAYSYEARPERPSP
ncbi:MAG: cobalamin-dependent protein [Sandaracinaceae bacterium]|nr:cobalamin-dependent protein [Sandaracinaceae bacterium]